MSTKSRQRKATLRRNAREMREDPLRLIDRRNDWPRRTYTIQVGALADDEVAEYIRKMQSSIKRDVERVVVDYFIPQKEEKKRKRKS